MSWAHASCTQHRTARTQDWSTAGRAFASLRAPGSTAGRKACWPEKPPWDGSSDLHAPTAALPTAPHDPITVLAWPATYQMADSSPPRSLCPVFSSSLDLLALSTGSLGHTSILGHTLHPRAKTFVSSSSLKHFSFFTPKPGACL